VQSRKDEKSLFCRYCMQMEKQSVLEGTSTTTRPQARPTGLERLRGLPILELAEFCPLLGSFLLQVNYVAALGR
jgi:hypothetical protein